MNEYRIRPDGLKRIRRRLLARTLPIMLIAVAAGTFIGFHNTQQANSEPVSPVFYLALFPFMLLLVLWSMYRGARRRTKLLESYTLMLTDNLLSREQDNTPTVAIYRREIRSITETAIGGLIVRGADAASVIVIYPEVERLDELRATLAQTMPIGVENRKRRLLTTGATVATLGLMIGAFTLRDKLLGTLCALACAGFLFWSFVKVRRSRNVEERAKRAIWTVFIVIASLLGSVIIRWTH